VVVAGAISVEVDLRILSSEEIDIVVEVQQAKVDVGTRASVKRANMVVAGASSVKVDIGILCSKEINIIIKIHKEWHWH
jgi:hypothetical protein